MLDLAHPELDWVAHRRRAWASKASRADTAGNSFDAFQSAMSARGPRLIEAVLSR